MEDASFLTFVYKTHLPLIKRSNFHSAKLEADMAPSSPLLTSVTFVLRHVPPQLQALEHVASAVHAFLDRSVLCVSVSSVVLLGSVDLVRRVAHHEEERWWADSALQRPSVWRARSYKMAQFEVAMELIALNGGSTSVAQWLLNEYAPKRSMNTVVLFQAAAYAGHAAVLTWLAENVRLWTRLKQYVLREVVERGHLDVLKWWLKYNNAGAFTVLEVDLAAGSGHLEVLQFMYKHACDEKEKPCSIRAIQNAGANGHLHIVQWLHGECGLEGSPFAMRGSLEVAKYLFEHSRDENDRLLTTNAVVIQCAAESGSIDFLDWALAHVSQEEREREQGEFPFVHVNNRSAEVIALSNHWHVLQWLRARGRRFCTPEIFRGAVGSGNIDMVVWLCSNFPCDWRAATLAGLSLDRIAAGSGHLEMVQWLHAKDYPFTAQAMDLAAKYGYLDVVQWLHANREEGCTVWAMNSACVKGHLDIVKFLHHNRDEGCTVLAMDKAAAKGHFEIVQFLHESQRAEGGTTCAMDYAAWRGHFEIVQYLHYNRTEGCTTWAMDKAASVEILEFLHRNRTEGCTLAAYVVAAGNGDLAILDWLYEHKPELLDLVQVRQAACDQDRYCVVMWAHAIVMEQQQQTSGS